MTKVLKIDATGKCAIWDDDSDELPFSDPLNHLSRLYFHSSLDYPQLISKHTGTLSLPARGIDSYGETVHTLFSHGAGGIPWVLGAVRNADSTGIDVALAGSVPIQMDQYGFSRWLTLGADGVNVVLHESYTTHHDAGLAALSLNYEIYITDRIIE